MGSITKSLPELIVLSRRDAERYEPQGVEVCISIGDPDMAPAPLSRHFAAVLRLQFHDITDRSDPDEVLFTAHHARAIRDFLDQWSSADRVVVHCLAGVSRSPGVALGLCDVRGWATASLEQSHPAWNRYVRSVIAGTEKRSPGR